METIIYLHGFRSSAIGSSKVEHLADFFPECKVIGLDYAPHDPVSAAKAIDDCITDIGLANVCGVVGTSLGGFWARWIAKTYPIVTVAINPSLEPWKTLKPGNYSQYDTGLQFTLTPDHIESFKHYSYGPTTDGVLHIFALDDEVLDSRKSLEMIEPSHLSSIFEDGGHRFERFERLEEPIRGMFYNFAG